DVNLRYTRYDSRRSPPHRAHGTASHVPAQPDRSPRARESWRSGPWSLPLARLCAVIGRGMQCAFRHPGTEPVPRGRPCSRADGNGPGTGGNVVDTATGTGWRAHIVAAVV